jgi:solute carrier family 25 folate transporter 32
MLSQFLSPAVINSLSGLGGGAICAIACSPLEVSKVRLQVQGSTGLHKYNGLAGTLKTIWREEGLRGYYHGIRPSLVVAPINWAVYFSVYGASKNYLKESAVVRENIVLHVIAATTAGAASMFATHPLWIVRLRMMTSIYHGDTVSSMKIRDVFRDMLQKEGASSFFKGIKATSFGLLHVAIQMPIMEEMKLFLASYREDRQPTSLDITISTFISKIIASSTTYPHEVVRSRMFDWRGVGDLGLVAAFKGILHHEGWKGFYRGFTINLARVLPSSIVTFVSQDAIRRVLENMR